MPRWFAEFGALELAAAIRSRAVSAREAVDACLDGVARFDSSYGAFVAVDAQAACRAAEAIDARMARGEPVGPLAGVPVGVKDLLFTASLRTTFGSAHYRDFVPEEDDVAVARLRRADAIIVGKTNTSEFGYGPTPRNALFPVTRNPWNTNLTPAGSSAGSAAAVAAGLVPLSLGSDGGGSIRVPAAFTGIVGFKPSFGRIPVYPGCRDERLPGVSSWETLEHIGPMTRTVADAAAAYAIMAGPDPRDRHSLPATPPAPARPIRAIAYSPDLGFAPVDAEVARLCEDAARALCRALGLPFHVATPPVGDIQETFEALVALDTDREGLEAMRKASGLAFGPALTRLLEQAWSADAFSRALVARKRAVNAMSQFMSEWDLLVTPATATAAFPLELDHPTEIAGVPVGPAGFGPFSAIANLTGQPAISIPAGLTADGRPVGLQIIGRRLEDEIVLTAASAFEVARPFPRFLDKAATSSHFPKTPR